MDKISSLAMSMLDIQIMVKSSAIDFFQMPYHLERMVRLSQLSELSISEGTCNVLKKIINDMILFTAIFMEKMLITRLDI